MMKTTLLLMLSLLAISPCFAATAEEKLQACDAALYAQKQSAELCSLGMSLRQDEMSRLNKEVSQLHESGQSWYNNVFVWAAVGVFVGAYVGTGAVR